jgi:uncharacterized membrane protein
MIVFMKRNWKCKLTSRKLWAAIIGVAISVMVILDVGEIKQQQIVGLITAISTLVAYIIGEGIVDVKYCDKNKNDDKDSDKKDE